MELDPNVKWLDPRPVHGSPIQGCQCDECVAGLRAQYDAIKRRFIQTDPVDEARQDAERMQAAVDEWKRLKAKQDAREELEILAGAIAKLREPPPPLTALELRGIIREEIDAALLRRWPYPSFPNYVGGGVVAGGVGIAVAGGAGVPGGFWKPGA
jgi:hypothetical protein